MTALHHLTLADAAERIRTGEFTSVSLVKAYLKRIEETQDTLAAYITTVGEAALCEASKADEEQASGHLRGRLHGIPIALKDVIATQGVRTTCHSQLLIDNVPTEDAFCVGKLKAAGAILLGKLATHEFAFGGPSHDLPFPPARNPWSLDHIPGGSSSGPGVAVAAGLCAGAIGTDTSGSIRMPAGACGVVGLKPTYGRVSRRGIYPLSFSLDHAGPMTWTVRDAAMLLQEIAGFDPGDTSSVDIAVPDYSARISEPISGLRVGIARGWYETSVDDDMALAMENALVILRDLGADVFDVFLPDLEDFNICGRIILLSEGYAIHKATLSAQPETYGKFTRDRMRLGGFISAEQYIQAQRLRQWLINQMASAMGNCDVVVCTNQYGPAERFDDATATFPFFGKPFLTIPFDVTGQPALSVPCGFATNGLPLAFQIAGRHFDEETVLRVGHAYEQGRRHAHPRPPH
jgi:aspartyl-tRNA(Asn)/glutamyl-tRNA(Gln) amidotransferase subunit A